MTNTPSPRTPDTRTSAGPATPATRVAGPLIASGVVLLFALPLAWMLAYFMKDELQTADHVVFLAVPVVELVVAGLVAGLVIGRSPRMSYRRAMAGALALVLVPLLAIVTVYAALSLTPLFDDAIGRSASDGLWLGVAATATVLAVLLFRAGVRLMRARP
ncbi:hypothetical protein KV097_12770 [Mumia sp. zg.B17]|uniref:hypothetical protein n=1 Tax=Mumia sp. zg.B17 TaxID=2855446 RepID=UPI001C6E4B2C|nr:hypothetical protein [Mumia sp. zg.B17]MBW9206816.1 hypothetical protein [Mumia sp. zg.B17]